MHVAGHRVWEHRCWRANMRHRAKVQGLGPMVPDQRGLHHIVRAGRRQCRVKVAGAPARAIRQRKAARPDCAGGIGGGCVKPPRLRGVR
jgi:hypothetical protein